MSEKSKDYNDGYDKGYEIGYDEGYDEGCDYISSSGYSYSEENEDLRDKNFVLETKIENIQNTLKEIQTYITTFEWKHGVSPSILIQSLLDQ